MRSLHRIAFMALAWAVACPAWANGRFPESQRIVEDPRSADRLFLAGTFGLLATEDRGKNWYYVCENAFAFAFLEGDPMLEVLSDGAVLSGIHQSLNVSRDCGCTWQYSLGESMSQNVADLTIHPSAEMPVIALLEEISTVPHKWELHESSDHGRTWRKLSDLPDRTLFAYTIDVAPSDPMRIYATGVSRPEGGGDGGVLFVSKNRGASWEELVIPGTSASVAPYIAAIDAKDPDTLYVRVDEWVDNVDPSANDALFVSTDGGKSWKELIRKGAKLFGFALSPDGSTLLAGFGDPLVAGGRSTEPQDYGVYKASTKDFVFEKVFPGMVSCLRWTATGLYVCNTEFNGEVKPADFTLGFAKNADFTLTTPNPLEILLSLKNVRGPAGCVATACGDVWTKGVMDSPPVCEQFQAACTLPPATAGLSCSPDGGGTGGSAGGRGDAGGAAGTATGGGGASAGVAGSAGGAGGDGCGCRITERSSSRRAPCSVLAALAIIACRSRRALRRRTA
jgi:hypothetical protein